MQLIPVVTRSLQLWIQIESSPQTPGDLLLRQPKCVSNKTKKTALIMRFLIGRLFLEKHLLIYPLLYHSTWACCGRVRATTRWFSHTAPVTPEGRDTSSQRLASITSSCMLAPRTARWRWASACVHLTYGAKTGRSSCRLASTYNLFFFLPTNISNHRIKTVLS